MIMVSCVCVLDVKVENCLPTRQWPLCFSAHYCWSEEINVAFSRNYNNSGLAKMC